MFLPSPLQGGGFGKHMGGKMKSLAGMIQQLEGLLGTRDISSWEEEFINNIAERVEMWGDTTRLSGAQADKIEQIWKKHFA